MSFLLIVPLKGGNDFQLFVGPWLPRWFRRIRKECGNGWVFDLNMMNRNVLHRTAEWIECTEQFPFRLVSNGYKDSSFQFVFSECFVKGKWLHFVRKFPFALHHISFYLYFIASIFRVIVLFISFWIDRTWIFAFKWNFCTWSGSVRPFVLKVHLSLIQMNSCIVFV